MSELHYRANPPSKPPLLECGHDCSQQPQSKPGIVPFKMEVQTLFPEEIAILGNLEDKKLVHLHV